MITWMQKHKKYLIVTIWVSTIAFVGAGFVGWGSVDFKQSASVAATVGDKKVTMEELNRAYSNIYDYYNQMSGGRLDEESAKKMGLLQMALQTLVNQSLVENYAHEMGIQVSDIEVSQKLAEIQAFQVDGKFNADQYKKQLENAHTNPKAFEDDLRKQLLVSKVRSLLASTPTPNEQKSVQMALTGLDRVSMKILTAKDVHVTLDDATIQKSWNETKSNYKSPERLDMMVHIYPYNDANVSEEMIKQEYQTNSAAYLGTDGKPLSLDNAKQQIRTELAKKVAKKEALKVYIDFKEGKIAGRKVEKVPLNNPLFTPEVTKTISTKKEGESLKPFETPQGYMMVKILKKYPAAELTFDEAKPYVTQHLYVEKTKEALDKKAKDEFVHFAGQDLGFIGKNDSGKFAGLSKEEGTKVLEELFASKKQDTTVILDDKFVLLRITDQKFDTAIDSNTTTTAMRLSGQIKENALDGGLLTLLKKRYKIEINQSLMTQKSETK